MTRTYLNVLIQGALFTGGAIFAQSFYLKTRSFGFAGAIEITKHQVVNQLRDLKAFVTKKLKAVLG